jgi:general secretion pathway protein G
MVVRTSEARALRQAIDAYTTDKSKPPRSLEDLVTAGYLKSVPQDTECDPIPLQEGLAAK